MNKILIILIVLAAGAFTPVSFVSSQTVPVKVQLAVPYVSEVPDGNWYGSWKNACEEASIAMLEGYYSGQKSVSIKDAKSFMQNLFNVQQRLWGSDANSDVPQTVKLINENSSYNGRQVEKPTVDDIKAELDAGRPVIVPINGFILANKNIPFLASGSGYHMIVLIGYDEAKKEFIANDSGDTISGTAHRYSYDLIMRTMRDYDAKRQKTDGPARAIFTYPKLAKTAASHRIYFLSDNTKQYVSHPLVFVQKGWSWSWVNVLADAFLRGLKDGAAIRPK